jgi:hypothetical protein
LNEDESIERKYNERIDNNSNKYLIENLIYYFEIYQENKYFIRAQKENLEKDDYSEIIGNDSLQKVIYAYDYYEKKFLKNTNLKLLYMIGYLKIYFKYYAKIIYKCKNNSEFFPFDSIKKSLNLSLNDNIAPNNFLKHIRRSQYINTNNIKLNQLYTNNNNNKYFERNKGTHIYNNFYSINNIGSSNAPVKVINVYN